MLSIVICFAGCHHCSTITLLTKALNKLQQPENCVQVYIKLTLTNVRKYYTSTNGYVLPTFCPFVCLSAGKLN